MRRKSWASVRRRANPPCGGQILGPGNVTGNSPKTARKVRVGGFPGTAEEVFCPVYVREELGGNLRWDDDQHRTSWPH